jgi:hypothetical protein
MPRSEKVEIDRTVTALAAGLLHESGAGSGRRICRPKLTRRQGRGAALVAPCRGATATALSGLVPQAAQLPASKKKYPTITLTRKPEKAQRIKPIRTGGFSGGVLSFIA